MTSATAIGCVLVRTHRGVIIAGRCSTSCRVISQEIPPCPTMIPARSVVTGTPDRASKPPPDVDFASVPTGRHRLRPVRRDRRCGPRPPPPQLRQRHLPRPHPSSRSRRWPTNAPGSRPRRSAAVPLEATAHWNIGPAPALLRRGTPWAAGSSLEPQSPRPPTPGTAADPRTPTPRQRERGRSPLQSGPKSTSDSRRRSPFGR